MSTDAAQVIPPTERHSMKHHPFSWRRSRKRHIAPVLACALALAVIGVAASTRASDGNSGAGSGSAKGLGPRSGLLPADHFTVESALQIDLSKESVRLPLYKGDANGQTVWFVLLDASDPGLAND